MNDIVKRMLKKYSMENRTETERALREVLQEITLLGLWRGKFFEHAAFYGGTALRILYGLDRFSEDLDFTLLDKNPSFDWNMFSNNVTEELSRYGFNITFTEKKKKVQTPIRSAFLKTNTLEALLQVTEENLFSSHIHPESVIRIKVELERKEK